MLAGLGLVVVVLLLMSSLNHDLGLPTCLAALCITAVVSVRKKANPLPLAKEISWPTLGLVAALFVLVDAVESIGALEPHRSRNESGSLSRCYLGFARHRIRRRHR